MVGLIRGVSEGLGPVGGAAAIYSLSGLLLIFTVGFPRIRQIPKGYLLAGSLLFVSYEICLALSLGYAATRHQAIEVGMVNYLWPSLTILFAILFNGQKTNWLIVPGLLLALVGVCWVLGGENGLHFVLLTGACLWIYYFLTPQPEMVFSTPVMIKLISAAFTLGFAYAAWNVGILHGNVTIMAVGSYFTPVLSSALAAVLLSAPLSFSFWQGALMVCGGSLLCWLATRRG